VTVGLFVVAVVVVTFGIVASVVVAVETFAWYWIVGGRGIAFWHSWGLVLGSGKKVPANMHQLVRGSVGGTR